MALSGIKLALVFAIFLSPPPIKARLIDNLVTMGPNDIIHVNAGDFEKEFHAEFTKYESANETTNRLSDMIQILRDSKYKMVIVDDIPNAKDPQRCLTCRAVTYSFLTFNSTGADDDFLEKVAVDLCLLLQLGGTENVCKDQVATFKPMMAYIVKHTENILPDRICGITQQSFECGSIEDLYEEFPVAFQEPTLPRNATSKSSPLTHKSRHNLTILHLTDFHYDPLYAVGSAAECKEQICCRGNVVPHNGAGFWGDYRGCDSPWHTLENVVEEIKRRYSKIDMIYFTGDIVDHFYWKTSTEGNKKSITDLTELFKKAFPGIALYPVLGNHEAHPSNTFAPNDVEGENISTRWLYEHIGDVWSEWLPQAALATLRESGYYSVKLYNGLRVIAINNNFCYHTNYWLLHNSSYFAQQLEWLQEALQLATTAKEKVHIISHIPSNERDCFGPWAREYRKLVEKFSPIISGIFNGHTHEDEFNVFYSKSDPSKALNVAWNGGSATTFAYFNSNFRLYYADLDTFEVLDYDTWWYNLTEANLTPDKKPTWQSYSFAKEYGLQSLSPANLDKLIKDFAHNRDKLFSYWKRKVKYSDAQLSQGCNEQCLTETLCDIVFVEHGDNTKCEELLKIFYS
ncbi:sphingomyelin phosphodiesterase 1-like [Lutzomyia longipalpis]|uniref:sphingomyelin phosphodiesterase 1-like n=1 Tax=Lutzomyia longipalpis TaxID=7200 RepID=UPI0024836482|nr:sphingomyelin phosphodiesterase 1-like [Lutzomyia longipalpis]